MVLIKVTGFSSPCGVGSFGTKFGTRGEDEGAVLQVAEEGRALAHMHQNLTKVISYRHHVVSRLVESTTIHWPCEKPTMNDVVVQSVE